MQTLRRFSDQLMFMAALVSKWQRSFRRLKWLEVGEGHMWRKRRWTRAGQKGGRRGGRNTRARRSQVVPLN